MRGSDEVADDRRGILGLLGKRRLQLTAQLLCSDASAHAPIAQRPEELVRLLDHLVEQRFGDCGAVTRDPHASIVAVQLMRP